MKKYIWKMTANEENIGIIFTSICSSVQVLEVNTVNVPMLASQCFVRLFVTRPAWFLWWFPQCSPSGRLLRLTYGLFVCIRPVLKCNHIRKNQVGSVTVHDYHIPLNGSTKKSNKNYTAKFTPNYTTFFTKFTKFLTKKMPF